MKKYILGLLIVVGFLTLNYANAACESQCNCANMPKGAAEQCQSACTACQSAGTQSSADAAKQAEAAKNACVADSTYVKESCTQGYSCETLFPDHATALKCNLKRCQKDRGPTSAYCICKYQKEGIPMNTNLPFLGNCIEKSDAGGNAATNAFPTVMSAVSKMLVTVILLVSFIMIIIGGIQRSMGNAAEGKKMITNVAIGIALLGLVGVILRFINPNFFK